MRSHWSLLALCLLAVNTVASHALLKHALRSIALPAGGADIARFVAQCASSGPIWGSLLLQVVGYGAWMAVIARERLALAAAVSGVLFYLLMAGVGWLIFHERLSAQQCAGLAMLLLGVMLMARG